MDNVVLEKIARDARYAAEHIDQPAAFRLLKKVEDALRSQEILKDAIARQKLQKIELDLKITAFPSLSDEESAAMLRDHTLDFSNINVPLEPQVTAKLFIVPYFVRDDLRKKLEKALLSNNQILGNFSVSQWIQKFKNTFQYNKTPVSPVEFLMHHRDAVGLSSAEREKLKDILHTYDYLLAATLPATGSVLNQILSYVEDTGNYDLFTDRDASIAKKHPDSAAYSFGPTAFLEVPLSQILQEYPAIGERAITNVPIRIKSSLEPVRPSIKNWIYDYRQKMRGEKGNTMQRGNYIYQSENGRKLSFKERERVSYLLKSLDENTPLRVDPGEQKIIFPSLDFQQKQRPANTVHDFQSRLTAQASTRQKTDATRKPPAKADWNEIREHWQKTTSERERNGRLSIIKKGALRQFQPQAAVKPPLGSVRDFHFSSPQKFESEENSADLKRAAEAKTPPPLKTASNDLDDIHSALTEQMKKTEEKKNIRSREYQIYPIGSSITGQKAEPKIKGNVVDLREDF